MTRLIATCCLVLSLMFSALGAQQSSNVTVVDCSGTSHDLFSELDNSKVVILCWVMPCNQCIAPSMVCSKVATEFQKDYAGRVVMYLIDDYGNTTCASLKSWATKYGINANSYTSLISNSSVKMTDFGEEGMPKIVVMAGKDHRIVYHEENTVSDTLLRASIQSALGTSDVEEAQTLSNGFSIWPNPASNSFNVTVPANLNSTVMTIYSTDARIVAQVPLEKGMHYSTLPYDCTELSSGLYFVGFGGAASLDALKRQVVCIQK